MLALRSGCNGATASAPPDYKESIQTNWGPFKRLRRRLLSPLFRIADSGVLGLTPLRTHILICGFPRSGTTLLQMMMENGMPEARRFGREIGAWRAAAFHWRNHAVLISKVPHDLFRLRDLRDYYTGRPSRLRTVLMLRDPRDVLTSIRETGGPEGYCVSSERWRRYYEHFLAWSADPDVLVIRYEDLVADPRAQQTRIEEFTGEAVSLPFAEFDKLPRPDFDLSTLNGLRAVEQTRVARWARQEHRARIEQVLAELPDLPEALIRLGYERDTSWIEEWSASLASPSAQVA